MAEKETTLDTEGQSGTNTAVPTPRYSTENEKGQAIDKEVEPSQEVSAEKPQDLTRIDSADYPSSWRLFMIVVALVLTVILVALDMTIVSTAIPRITDQFHSLNQVGWYGSAFFLTMACFQSFWGKLYKFYSLKWTLITSIAIFEIGSLICAVSKDSTTLIVGRAIAGWGGAGASSGCYTVIGFSAPPSKRPMFTGIIGAAYSVASVMGPLIGGAFTDNLSWRWCFYINLPLGGASLVILGLFFSNPAAARAEASTWKEIVRHLDLPGIAILIPAVVCYILALQWGGTTKAWNSADVIGVLVGFGVLILIFIAIEIYSGDYAIIQGRLLRDRTVGMMCALVFFISAGYFGLLYYLPIYFQATRGVSAQKSGIDTLPLVLGSGIFTVISGGIITVTGHYNLVLIIGMAIAVISTALIYTLEIHTGTGKWLGYQILAGIGFGASFQVPIIVNQAMVTPSDISSVSATTLFFMTIGGAFFISAAEAGFINKLVQRVPFTAPGVDPKVVALTGATQLRSVFSASDIPGILVAYMDGLKVSFAIVIATTCIAFLLTFTPRWNDNIKGKVGAATSA